MHNNVLATKWRPKSFDQIVGQDSIIKPLINSLNKNRLHHSYLFTGTRGVGKTTIARLFAKCINCETNGVSSSPCGTCNSCESIDNAQFVDLYEVDAASKTKVEDIRELLENVQYMPTQGKYKVYLIDEVHMLSTHSFNALLKTLEEPPEYVKFILATTDPQKIPSTILSRCLNFNLTRINIKVIESKLADILNSEKIKYEEEALRSIANSADGSMRDALSITEQCISYDDNILSYENVCKTLCYLPKENINKLVELISNSKLNDIVNLIEEFYLQSIDFENLLKELISIFHNSLVSKKTGLRYEGDNEFSINKIASSFENEVIQEMYRSGIDSLKDFPYAPNHKCAFEMAILNILLVCEPKSSEIKKKNKEIGETKPDTNEKTSTITGSRSISWEDTITKLKLDQITLNLANNLELSNHDNNRITFLISESLSGLVTERCKLKLKEALCLYYKDKIEIDINFTDNNLDTVQDKVNEKKQKELESAKKTLVEDDFVKILQDKYNAEIISGSVKTNEE